MDDTNTETGGAAAERPDTALQEVSTEDHAGADDGPATLTADGGEAQRRRRRGSRGGQRRRKGTGPGVSGGSDDDGDDGDDDLTDDVDGRTDNDGSTPAIVRSQDPDGDVSRNDETEAPASVHPDELPEPMREGRVMSVEAADKALVRKPQIGDTRPAPPSPDRRDAGPRHPAPVPRAGPPRAVGSARPKTSPTSPSVAHLSSRRRSAAAREPSTTRSTPIRT